MDNPTDRNMDNPTDRNMDNPTDRNMDNPTAYFEDIFKQDPSHLNLSDGTLLTEDGYSFRIHKIALAKCSGYFSALLCGIGKGKKDYSIPGIKGEVLSNILYFLYTEQIEITEKNICDIIVASDYFLLDDLVTRIKSFLTKNLSVANCLGIHECLWSTGHTQINRKDVLRESYRYIQIHFEQVLFGRDEKFSKFPVECLKNLLNDKNLRVQNENIVWKAIVIWVTADTSNRLARVPGLLMYLRIDGVHENLAKDILTHAIVARNTFCKVMHFKSETSWRNILKLHQCHVWNDTQFCPFYIPRKPSRLNFIAYYCPWADTEETQIYVTYDENVDQWRKIIEVHRRPHYLVSLGDCIYLFHKYEEEFKLRYNVIEKQWMEFEDITVERFGYAVVTLGGFLYILGGRCYITEEDIERGEPQEMYDVEVYDPEEDTWREITPMLPIVRKIFAVTLNDRIYVVGPHTTRNVMAAQMYNPSTGNWFEIPRPSSYSELLFSLAAYNDKIYIIGRNTEIYEDADDDVYELNPDFYVLNAEVFDPLHSVWHPMQSLPHFYTSPRAIVINDQLIACEDPDGQYPHKLEPPVYWNNEQECWETFTEPSPFFNIHHYFFRVEEGDSIDIISNQNKIPTTAFEKSPFS